MYNYININIYIYIYIYIYYIFNIYFIRITLHFITDELYPLRVDP